MLLLDSRCAVIDGISVFPDHADPLQWYYLPTRPHLTVVDGTPMFQLVGFRGGDTDGALLSFDCNIGLTQAQIDALQQKVKSAFRLDSTPRLAPVPPVDGTVRLLIMATDTATPDETAPFVVTAVHNAKPSLYGENAASFSVLLDADGYSILQGVLDAAILPIAVVYSLDYLALRPAYQVSLTIDWERVQEHLDESFGAKAWIFSSDISKAVDELDESKAIALTADTFVPEDTDGVIQRRDAALAQVKAMITSAFFEPSLPPWKPDNPTGWVQDLKELGEFATKQIALAAGGLATAALPVSFSYKKTHYTRIDKRSLDVSFSERTTVRRTIYPQGHLTALLSDIAASPQWKDKLVREVTASDFFKKRTLKVLYRPNLGAAYIDSIDVYASYGGLTRNTLLTAKDDWSADFQWLSDIRDGVMRKDVEVSYRVRFTNSTGSRRPAELASPPRTVNADLASLLPEEEVFTIRPVSVLADRIPWDRFPSVDVQVRYRDENNKIDQREPFRLTKEKPETLWPMFVVDRSHTSYEVRTVIRAAGGHDVDSGWSTSDLDEIRVVNPFRPRTLAVLVAVPWAEIREIFVDVRYQDDANALLVEDTLVLTQATPSPTFVVDLRDPTQTAIDYTVTFSYLDGRVVQLPPSTTYASRITVDPTKPSHRVVEVRAPGEWVQREVERIVVELRFEDFLANLSYADRLELDGPGTKARFEFDYADETRNKYEWRSTVLFRNGLRHETDWKASADPVLVPRLP